MRIELFGDTVDSLRSFDTDNQRSTGQLDQDRHRPGRSRTRRPMQAVTASVGSHLEASGPRESKDDDATVRVIREPGWNSCASRATFRVSRRWRG